MARRKIGPAPEWPAEGLLVALGDLMRRLGAEARKVDELRDDDQYLGGQRLAEMVFELEELLAPATRAPELPRITGSELVAQAYEDAGVDIGKARDVAPADLAAVPHFSDKWCADPGCDIPRQPARSYCPLHGEHRFRAPQETEADQALALLRNFIRETRAGMQAISREAAADAFAKLDLLMTSHRTGEAPAQWQTDRDRLTGAKPPHLSLAGRVSGPAAHNHPMPLVSRFFVRLLPDCPRCQALEIGAVEPESLVERYAMHPQGD